MSAESGTLRNPPSSSGQQGWCVVIVGASGVGKDSLIGYARACLAGDKSFVFLRRVITRAADPETENHVPVDREEFRQMERGGAFCVNWDAHGLSYGIPVAALEVCQSGRTAVFNGSRQALDACAKAFARMMVIEIAADSKTVKARLAGRNRETAGEIATRLSREAAVASRFNPVRIDNNARLEDAGDMLVTTLQNAAGCSQHHMGSGSWKTNRA